MNEAFGMMDEGYFTSRGEILTWINDLLKVYFIFNEYEKKKDPLYHP